MNNMNFSPDMMDNLLKLAGQKLGKDPADLKSQLENGNLNGIIGGLDPKVQSRISEIAGDPKAMESLMKNNNLNTLLSGIMKDKK